MDRGEGLLGGSVMYLFVAATMDAADHQGLFVVRALLFHAVERAAVEHVAHERAHRLHRHVDGGVEDPEHAGREPEHRRVRHHHERERGADRADEEVRLAPAQPVPGAVAEVANDGLHQKTCDRCG